MIMIKIKQTIEKELPMPDELELHWKEWVEIPQDNQIVINDTYYTVFEHNRYSETFNSLLSGSPQQHTKMSLKKMLRVKK